MTSSRIESSRVESSRIDNFRQQSTAIDGNRNWRNWRWQLRHCVVDLPAGGRASSRAAEQFGFRVTPYYHALGLKHEAVRHQWLPDARELLGDGESDPFNETLLEKKSGVKGLVQRFDDRVLVRVTSRCAVICRHCTRKNPLGAGTCGSLENLDAAVEYVRSRPKVREVLLSGGDALMLEDAEIGGIVEAFASLPQVDAVRVGTRLPVVLPMRVTRPLAKILGRTKKVWVNTQFNHPAELTPESAAACGRLVDAGIPVSSQGVLLAGVNDDADVLCALFSGLQRMRVRPYYMFVCDRVAGTSHFRVDAQRARELEREVSARLGGLAVPRFVADRPGAKSKIPVGELS